MRVEFGKVTDEYVYPIYAKDVREVLQAVVPSEMQKKIRKIRFGCNQKTTQEARIVAHGTVFDIRVNFCLKNSRTPLLSEKREWLECIRSFGGEIDPEANAIRWAMDSARRYAIFLLLHEIAHIIYAENHADDWRQRTKSSPPEEKWCDNYARSKASCFK